MKTFVSLEEAMKILDTHVYSLGTETLPLLDCSDKILAEDVYAPINVPPFNKSAMDGYAIQVTNHQPKTQRYNIIETVYAGSIARQEIKDEQTAIRIMTGAPIPKGANVVVKQEEVQIQNQSFELEVKVNINQNICFAGEDISKHTQLIKKYKTLDYADIGVLASVGMESVKVFHFPKVAFISTGDEVLDVNEPLHAGKIYNSNKYSLLTRLKELNCKCSSVHHVKDDVIILSQQLKKAATVSDIILTTGGASVGEKDLLIEALKLAGADILFWKVKIKPGSAVVCGKLGKTLVIGLSGNPTAALTTFELLVNPILHKMKGYPLLEVTRQQAFLQDDIMKKSPQRRYLRGYCYVEGATQVVTLTQVKSGNGMLSSTLESNCLIEVAEYSENIKKGSLVQIIKFK